MSSRPSFRPQINERSANIARTGPICETLYEDAVRRKKQRDIPAFDEDKCSTVSRKNNKIAGDKLVKEYAKTLETMGVDGSQPLSLHQMHQIFKHMQFVQTEKVFDAQP